MLLYYWKDAQQVRHSNVVNAVHKLYAITAILHVIQHAEQFIIAVIV